MQLEDLQPRSAVRGVHPDGLVTVVSVQWFGSEALELTYKTPAGPSPTSCSTATTSPGLRSSLPGGRGASTATGRCSGWCPRHSASEALVEVPWGEALGVDAAVARGRRASVRAPGRS